MLVIFDCDGVLIDSEVIACRIDAEELARLGFAITAQEVASRFCGTTMQSMFTALEAEQAITIPKGFADHLRARLQSAFEAELRPMAGIRQGPWARSRRGAASPPAAIPSASPPACGSPGSMTISSPGSTAPTWCRGASRHRTSSSMWPARWGWRRKTAS